MRVKPQLYIHHEDGRYEQVAAEGKLFDDIKEQLRKIVGGPFEVHCYEYQNCTFYVTLKKTSKAYKKANLNCLCPTLGKPDLKGKIVFFYGFYEYEYAELPEEAEAEG